jgi:hypothetical protein
MSDLIQIFCNDDPPTLKQIMEFLSEEGFDVKFDDMEEEAPDQEDPSWTEARLMYTDEQEAIVVECWRSEESDEFDDIRDELLIAVEELEDDSTASKKVLRRLKKSQFVIQILPCDCDEDGENVINALTSFMVADFGGLVFVEEEGFYDGDELVLEME